MTRQISSDTEQVVTWLRQASRGHGLTPSKVLASPLLDLCSMPESWAPMVRGARLLDLIVECAAEFSRDLDSDLALTALGHHGRSQGPTQSRRFRQLIELLSRTDNPTAVSGAALRARWRRLSIELAKRTATAAISLAPSEWEMRSPTSASAEDAPQPFFVERLEVAYFIDSKGVCTETITQRWLSADLSYEGADAEIDHYRVRARYLGAGGEELVADTWIYPLLNCVAEEARINADGWMSINARFPHPLRHGEETFFATRVRYKTDMRCEPPLYIRVTTMGVRDLVMRVQFAGGAPQQVWFYGGPIDPEAKGSDDLRRIEAQPNEVGYVEYVAENCPSGWFYAVGWTWDATDTER
jgi:hypothetical protein